MLNVRWIQIINRHPVESDADSAPEIISDTQYWLHCNGDLDNPNASEADCMADVESDCKGTYAGAPQYRDMIWYTVAQGRERDYV